MHLTVGLAWAKMSLVSQAVKVSKQLTISIKTLFHLTLTHTIKESWLRFHEVLITYEEPTDILPKNLTQLVPFSRIISDSFFSSTSLKSNEYFCTLMAFLQTSDAGRREAYVKQPGNQLPPIVVLHIEAAAIVFQKELSSFLKKKTEENPGMFSPLTVVRMTGKM